MNELNIESEPKSSGELRRWGLLRILIVLMSVGAFTQFSGARWGPGHIDVDTDIKSRSDSLVEIGFLVNSLNLIQPDLDLEVIESAAQSNASAKREVLRQLKRLDEIISEGSPYFDGELWKLSCSAAPCGGPGSGSCNPAICRSRP